MKKLTRRSLAPALLAALLGSSAASLFALPRDRAYGRQGARDSRQTGRQTSRARRRSYWGMPPGAIRYPYGGYNYYMAGGVYYYPYYVQGRTCYVEVNVYNGQPGPPPPANQVYADINVY